MLMLPSPPPPRTTRRIDFALTDYGIAGLMLVPNMCWFVYNGSDYRDGQSRSIVAESDVTAVGGSHFHHCRKNCKKDYLEVIELLTEVTDAKRLLQHFAVGNAPVRRQVGFNDFAVTWRMEEQRKTHSFCGDYIPGPLIPSPDAKALLLVFRTDETEAAVGFQLKFQFLPIARHFSNGEDLCATVAANTTESGGVLRSPGYPSAYPSGINCEWKLSVSQPAQGVMIHFTDLAVEGSFKECKNAVIRIRVGDSVQSVASICGFASVVPAFVTNHTSLAISMLTTENANGAKGFQLIWTKILSLKEGNKCTEFLCKQSHHCIAKEMECNGYANCGTYTKDGHTFNDDSDETTNCGGTDAYSYLHIGVGIILTIVTLACLCVCIIYREHRRKRNKAHDPLDNVPGDEDEEVTLYSPHNSINLKDKPSLSFKQLVDTGCRRCQHLTNSQVYSPPAPQNRGVGELTVHCHHNTLHHDVAHYCPNDPPTVCSRSSSHSVKSNCSPNSPIRSLTSAANSHCSTCPFGHALLISSPPPPPPPPPLPLALQQTPLPLHNHSHVSSRRNSCSSEAKERMQKISIV
ncbi:Low-density lipoprotein receptor-related protein 12 [Taenia crassiceps]|uniref:Low-density lipoprotein receptor-related protein 12 n=1 Tax=Taenia crassiceps TaxID=6207 RepID=A0ABR4Q0J9_9CEST